MRVAIAMILLTTAPAAAGHDDELTLGSYVRALRSASANALTEDSFVGAQLGYARELGLALAPRLALWAVATLVPGTADGTMFQTLDTHLSSTAMTLGARARYTLHPRLIAHARLEAGAARASVELEDAMGHSAKDAGWGAVTAAGLGLDLLAIATPRFSLGLRAELGYIAATAIELTALSDRPSDGAIELPMMAAPLGALDLGGRWFGFSLVSQF